MTRDNGPLDTDATSMGARTVCGHTGRIPNTGSMMTGPHASLEQPLEKLLEVASFSAPVGFVEHAKVTARACAARLSTRRRGAPSMLASGSTGRGRSPAPGKIMRRLREVTEGRELDEVSTLGDLTVVTTLKPRIAIDGGGSALWMSC